MLENLEMHNQPFSEYRSEPESRFDAVDSSQLRLRILQIVIPVCLVLTAIRVVHLQAVIGERFISPWEKTETRELTLPARNGRILARDGTVLAFDETRYDVSIDYRWLESPSDPLWLRGQVYQRLDAQDRSDPAQRKQAETAIESERQAMFQRLARLSGVNVQTFKARASVIQERVERMVIAVEARREQLKAENDPQQLRWEEGVRGIFEVIQAELTTPPRRYADDPIILKEELQPHVLLADVPLSVVASIESNPHAFPGVYVDHRSSRVYPMDDVASHVIGIRKPKNPDDPPTGQGGVEQAYDHVISAKPGTRAEEVDRRGEIVHSNIVSKPVDGQDIVLTIDSQLQQSAERLLDQSLSGENSTDPNEPRPVGGAVIVLDLWTGDVLTAAAAPRISLEILIRPTNEEWQQLLESPNQPFFPRATQMALPPGSVFKVITAVAGMESGTIRPDDFLTCQGYLHRTDQLRCQIYVQHGRGHGLVNVDDALCQSCNVFFYHLTEQMGAQPLLEWADRFGFGRPTGIDLPTEAPGRLPGISQSVHSSNQIQSQSLQLAIGQGELLATPLQVARLMAAIGNGGYLVTPHVVLDRGTDQKEPTNSTLQKIEGLSPETLSTVRAGLEMVVHHPLGTGVVAMTPAMTIAAKTGTAQTGGKPDHAWFAGYAPAESPRIAFAVVLEHGGSGGTAAGPIVRELITEMIGLGYLRPKWGDEETEFSSEGDSEVVELSR